MSKILLVEDDKSLREIYGVRLSAEGYEIVAAGDGEEALAIAVKERPDLIISDVMMPKISGFDMLDILRATPETKDLKVIMMTALSSEDQRQRGESLGANRYLVKSQVGIEDVVRAVHEVLLDTPGAQQEANNDFSNVQPPVERSEDSVPLGVAASQADIEAALAAAPPIPEDPVPIVAPAPAPEEAVVPAPETPAPVVATPAAEAPAQAPAPAPVAQAQEVAPAPAPVAQAQEATAQPALNPEPSHSTLPDEHPVSAPAVNQAEQPVAPSVSTLPPEANAIPQPQPQPQLQPQPQPQAEPQPQPVATPAPVAPVEAAAPVAEAPAPVVPPAEAPIPQTPEAPQPQESMQLPTPTAPFSTPAPDSLRSQALPTDLPSQQEQPAPAPSLEVAAPAPVTPVAPVEPTAPVVETETPVAEAPVAPATAEPIPAPAPAADEPTNTATQFQHEALIQPPEASVENSNGYEKPEQAPLAGKAPDIKPFTPPQPLDHTNDPDYSKMLDEELNDGPPAFPPSPEA